MPREFEPPEITPSQASYIVGRLLESGRLSRHDVDSLLSQMKAEVSELEARLARLRTALRGSGGQRKSLLRQPPINRDA